MYMYVSKVKLRCEYDKVSMNIPISGQHTGWACRHSVSYSFICDVCREWVNEVGFFLKFLFG